MIVPYTKLPSNTPGFKFFWRPYVDVRLLANSKSIRMTGVLVDSGADGILIHKDFAQRLGINWQSGIASTTFGLGSPALPTYYHTLELEVINLKGSRKTVTVGFVDIKDFGMVLGQQGFFENFVVRFKHSRKIFDIEVAP